MDLRRVYWAALCIAAFIYQNSASAEIRYSTGPISEGLVDVNDDASPDFRFGTLVNAFAPDPWLSLDGGVTYTFSVSGVAPFHPDYVNPNGVLVDGSHPLQLQGGESIGPDIADGLSWRHDFRSLLLSFRMGDHGQSFGPWGLSPAGLLGLRLQSGVDNYYGWIRVHGDDIIDWAYESTPNTPIIAGAVPEPAAWLLIVAAAAIMAGWKLRRRVLPLLLCVFIQVAANGEIIHRTAVRPGSFEPFDLDENGQLDFRFDVKTAVTEPDHLSIFFAIEQIGGAHNGVLADSDTVPALSPGFVVGPDSLGLSWDDEFVERKIPDVSPAGSLLGHPPAPPTQFVGIRLRADDGWHYGWARLAQSYWAPFDRDHPNWPEDTGSVPYFALPRIDTYNPGLIDWAYESTPDAPIIAGAVPEPGSIALVLTAIVFSCVLIGRRFLARQRGYGTWFRVSPTVLLRVCCCHSLLTTLGTGPPVLDHLLLCTAAFVAGGINSIAGGGTLITFPALVSVLGASPLHQVIANATNTVALCPGSATGAWAYRHELGEARVWMGWLLAPSLIGGITGAVILVYAPAEMFALLVPWLILLATLLFLFQPAIARWTGIGRPHPEPSRMRIMATLVFQFLVAVYGGYFGAGIGILMLSALAMMGMSDIHQMNALKTVLATVINGVAVVVFIGRDLFASTAAERTVDWQYAVPMIIAGMIGGYTSARVARSLNRNLVRRIVVAIGFCLAAYYFWENWR